MNCIPLRPTCLFSKQFFFLLALLVTVSSCRKYRIAHSCKGSPFVSEGFFLPNYFTPNGDGANDFLEFFHDQKPVSNFTLIVKNALGAKMFETGDPDFKWDGTHKGRIVKQDGYKVELSFDAGSSHYHYKTTLLVYWQGDPNTHTDPNICVGNIENCATGSQWDGNYNPLLPINEYLDCR
jgi:gliding motility-associated-like protein